MNYYLPEQCVAFDATLEQTYGFNNTVLMENAGRSCAEVILSVVPMKSRSILVLCGPGHNGGDGCVIARVLTDLGYTAVHVIHFRKDSLSDACRYHSNLLTQLEIPYDVLSEESLESFEELVRPFENAVCIDALFGVGVRPEFNEFWLHVFNWVNEHASFTIAIDHPSGFSAQDGASVPHAFIQPQVTCSIAFAKFAHATYVGKTVCGEVVLCDAGFPRTVVETFKPYAEGLNKETVVPLLKAPRPHDHKNKLGHLALFAGSKHMPGALRMAVQAALGMGVGKITVLGREDELVHLKPLLDPEVMYLPIGKEMMQQLVEKHIQACVVGPGLADPDLQESLAMLFSQKDIPVICDAEVFNTVSADWARMTADPSSQIAWIGHLGEQAVFFGEADVDHFFSLSMHTYDKWVETFPHHLWLRKGAGSVVVSHQGRYVNESGNVGLAKGGSGDVLAGMIGALATRLSLHDALCASVFLHGYVADELVEGGAEVTPSACLQKLPSVIKEVYAEHALS